MNFFFAAFSFAAFSFASSAAAFSASAFSAAVPQVPVERPQFVIKCFNCNKEGHSACDCPLPQNEAKIKAARDKYLASKPTWRGGSGRGGRGSGRGSPAGRGSGAGRGSAAHSTEKPRTVIDGKPVVYNSKGEWVLDTKAAQALKKAQESESKKSATKAEKAEQKQKALAALETLAAASKGSAKPTAAEGGSTSLPAASHASTPAPPATAEAEQTLKDLFSTLFVE